MIIIPSLCRAAAIAAFCLSAPAVLAAAPDALDPVEASPPATGLSAPIDYSLDTEMVVRNWVICVSQEFAEQLVRARDDSIEKARETYVQLNVAHYCGQLPTMQVILQGAIAESTAVPPRQAKIFNGLVNFAGDWASVFIVTSETLE